MIVRIAFHARVQALALAAGLALAGAASAQSLPKPAEFYFDADARALKPLVAAGADTEAEMQRLLRKVERDPQAQTELAQLAHLAMRHGRVDTGRALYGRALARIDRNNTQWRAVVWNYGWDLYRAGDAPGAFAQWVSLNAASRNVNAAWMPPTYALALWTLGRRDEAVQWYAAAVRTQPGDWTATQGYARLLPDWQPAERDTLAQVHAAWVAAPPSWP